MINGWIMSGDTAVASFHGRVVTPILPERCPLCFQKGGDLEAWLESRAIDRHRTNSRILKRILRLGDTSDLNTALHVHGATITDNYWVKTEDEANLTWADVGFRENYFADLALSGRFSSIAKNYTPEELRTATPELTNIGSYEKCWRQQDGHWVMVKSGTLEEHFSEFLDENRPEVSRRIVSDYRETISDLLLENFSHQWTDWAHKNGSITRNQAHGSPGNLIDIYASVDIPECEGFGLSQFHIEGLRQDSLTKKNDSDLSRCYNRGKADEVIKKDVHQA